MHQSGCSRVRRLFSEIISGSNHIPNFHAVSFADIDNSVRTVPEFGFIRIPVPEEELSFLQPNQPSSKQKMSIPSPLRLFMSTFNAFLSYVEIHSSQLFYNDRVLYTFIGGDSQMPAAHIVEAARDIPPSRFCCRQISPEAS